MTAAVQLPAPEQQDDELRVIVVVSGELDLASAPVLLRTLMSFLEGAAPEVIVELEAVAFMDLSGLRVLIEAHDAALARQKVLTLVNPGPQVRRLLELTGAELLLSVISA